jgi:secondary thiamine-phosphate synthase enzyme
MRQATHIIHLHTRGKGLYEFTAEAERWTSSQGLSTGLLTVFVQHTSASLLIQENADPDVRTDLENFLNRLVPENTRDYIHTIEGPDDMPAHIRAALTATQLSIPLLSRHLALGSWQGLYLFEHRTIPHIRQIVLHLLGE